MTFREGQFEKVGRLASSKFFGRESTLRLDRQSIFPIYVNASSKVAENLLRFRLQIVRRGRTPTVCSRIERFYEVSFYVLNVGGNYARSRHPNDMSATGFSHPPIPFSSVLAFMNFLTNNMKLISCIDKSPHAAPLVHQFFANAFS